ncbi:MAG: chemoreceptor glutamine deamidase CheD [Thiobacillaceae bacterium]|jgi:chemotaxis protein CheD|nr:chemoreceptor glutamine deamidase CheD [Thiobacillaceae bacterium]
MTQPGYEEVLAPNQYFDRNFDKEAAKILPGEYYATGRDMLLVTVLGSCVSACIRDPVSGIGGMNHFMLPESGNERGDPLSNSARYGGYAMEVLINQLVKLGASRARLEAKVFGGAAVLRGFTTVNVGERNSDFVIDYLRMEKIRLVAHDLLGFHPRKVYYFPTTGRILVKKLKSVHNNTIIEREREYGSRLSTSRIAGEVELF